MRPEEARDPLDDFTEHVARRAKLAELGERVLEILQAEQRPAMVSREDFREWRPTAALVSAEIHAAASSLGLLPGEEAKPEYEPDPTGEYHLRIKRPGEEGKP